VVATLAWFTSCAPLDEGKPALSATRLLEEIAVLASDSLEGRRPGTPGEDRTIAYLTAAFAAAGLEPGNPDGSWTQPITFVGVTSVPTLVVRGPGGTRTLAWKTDYVAQSRREVPAVDVAGAELVFVGHGVSAPEFGWDDYKDADVAGKTVVMLVGDPPVRLASDTAALDPAVFRGAAMTYYGRWTYKFEEATRRGAAAVLIVHQTEPASYPWAVVEGGWTGERMDVSTGDAHAGRVAVEGWLSIEAATRLFADAGLDVRAQEALARTRDFQPVSLRAAATFHVDNTMRTVATHNVIAKLPGSDPAVADEYVILTAHWDHFGFGAPVDGDSIYNGARDNASGTAALLELAHAYAAAGAPRRTLLFLAVTGEEQGLLGSKWYAENPLYPLERTLADINIDVLNTWGPTRDITVVGSGNTSLEAIVADVAAATGRTVAPDPKPEAGSFYRSDHFEFAKQGVPALYLDEGVEFIGKPAGFGKAVRDRWDDSIYHSPADAVDPAWDLSGAIADLELLYTVGRRVADSEVWPTWLDGTEFKAARERMLGRTP
jgi:Zn-dependent M28 family amino/carboxypeptidase